MLRLCCCDSFVLCTAIRFKSHDNSVGIATILRAGRSGFDFRQG